MILSHKRAKDETEIRKDALKWGKSATVGQLRISLKSARLDIINGESLAGQLYQSNSLGLVVVLLIETHDKTKVYKVEGSTEMATLTDTLGNEIPGKKLTDEFGFPCRIQNQLNPRRSHEVRSDGPLIDTLDFDKPVEAATDLMLHLDARAFGGSDDIYFEIPVEVWKPGFNRGRAGRRP